MSLFLFDGVVPVAILLLITITNQCGRGVTNSKLSVHRQIKINSFDTILDLLNRNETKES